MTPPTPNEALHLAYVRLTGRPLELDYLKRQEWGVWQRYCQHEPFTLADLELVVRYLQAQIKKGERKPGSLKFKNLISSPDYFQEDLIDARQWARRPAQEPGKAQALRSTGRPADAPERAIRTPAMVLGQSPNVAELILKLKQAVNNP